MPKATNEHTTPGAQPDVLRSNVIAFPSSRPAAARLVPPKQQRRNQWASRAAVQRTIAEVEQMPVESLLDAAAWMIGMARLPGTNDPGMACAFKAMLCLCRALDAAGFPVPALEARP